MRFNETTVAVEGRGLIVRTIAAGLVPSDAVGYITGQAQEVAALTTRSP